MDSYPSLRELLLSEIQNIIVTNSMQLNDERGKLKMTSSLLLGADELIFCHRNLGMAFEDMHIVVNPDFLDWYEAKLMEVNPDYYDGLTRNAVWKSIDMCVKERYPLLLCPISFLTMGTCFRGNGNREINLTRIIDYCLHRESESHLMVVLSSEEDEHAKKREIESAGDAIKRKHSIIDFRNFYISDGDYYGLYALFH